MKSKKKVVQPQKEMCATCPFREESPYKHLRQFLEEETVKGASRLCHSTGKSAIFSRGTGKEPKVCRGARNLALRMMFVCGIIDAETDEAWNKKVKELGLE